MTFEDITGDGRLWAVRYEGHPDNILAMTFEKWNDHDWLRDFFKVNSCDLSSYFKITNLNQAIYDTLKDAEELERMEEVRNHLIDNGVTDLDGFVDFVKHN